VEDLDDDFCDGEVFHALLKNLKFSNLEDLPYPEPDSFEEKVANWETLINNLRAEGCVPAHSAKLGFEYSFEDMREQLGTIAII